MDNKELENVVTKLLAQIDWLNDELADQEEAGARDRANAKHTIDNLKTVSKRHAGEIVELIASGDQLNRQIESLLETLEQAG